jgi:hypothetical protein
VLLPKNPCFHRSKRKLKFSHKHNPTKNCENYQRAFRKYVFDIEDLTKISSHKTIPLNFVSLTFQEWVCEQPAAQEEAVVAPEQDYGVPLAPVLPPVQEYGAPQVSQHLT